MGFRSAGFHAGSADPDTLNRHTNHLSASILAKDIVQGSIARTVGPGFSRLSKTPEKGSGAKTACMLLQLDEYPYYLSL